MLHGTSGAGDGDARGCGTRVLGICCGEGTSAAGGEESMKASSRAKGKPASRPELLRRLQKGAVICAEGYLFEFERRGYLQAGAFVPEVVLEHPELVEQLHTEFVRAGSDVVEAFTYYAHRAKLRLIGREKDLAPMNRTALKIAKKVAKAT